MTSLASMPSTAVEPMWSTRNAFAAARGLDALDDPRGMVRPCRVVRHQFAASPSTAWRVRILCASGSTRLYQRSRAFSTSSPCEPELSSSTSAIARRCSSGACALMRARASASSIPRLISRSTRVSTAAVTTTTSGNIGAIPVSTSSGMSSTTTASSGTASMISWRRLTDQRMHDGVQLGPLLVVDERLGGQRGTVQCTIGQQDVLAERLDQLRRARRCRARRPRGR